MEKYQSYRLPPLVYLGSLVHLAKECRESLAPLHLYLYDLNTTWSIRFMFIFGGEFYFKLVLFIIHLRVHRSSFVLVTNTLVKGPDKDG